MLNWEIWMLRHNVENPSDERDGVELCRRSFFGRLFVGAALSIAMPGVVHAAKSSAVKADKNHRLAQSAKTAVRLPKKRGDQALRTNHTVGKQQKAISGKAMPVSKKGKADHGHLHTAQVDHNNHRVRDIYSGKKQILHTASNDTHRSLSRGGRVHSVIQPVSRETFFEPAEDSLFLGNNGRLGTHRSIEVQNPHTGDKLNLTYFEKGRYLTDALNEISILLRDYRTGDVHPIDPQLLDQLHDLKQMLGLYQPFDVICGYRSPLTNARLHAEHSGVANNSFHMHGRAVDIRIERFDLRRMHNAAIAMHRGGVGYYPESNFIHLDTGTFRTWTL